LIPSFDETGTLIKNLYPSIGSCFVWLAVPLCTVIAWVFHTKECIGHIGKYLFEGSASDVPISTISRDIQMIFVKY
jgi:putative membrane protein|tara:strand:- start:2026 stop:2253 length:228 start_codon:yes stop_codon:yes gene_type:complete